MATPIHTPRVNNNDDLVKLIRVVVKPGDWVDAGALVAEVETDKASFTVESVGADRRARLGFAGRPRHPGGHL